MAFLWAFGAFFKENVLNLKKADFLLLWELMLVSTLSSASQTPPLIGEAFLFVGADIIHPCFYLLRGGGGPSKMVEEGFFI